MSTRAFTLALLIGLAAPAASAQTPAYVVKLRLEPGAGTLQARVEIESAGAAAFVLSRDLAVERVEADGAPVGFEEDAPGADGLRRVRLPVRAGRLVVEYGGRLLEGTYPRLVSQVNGISAGRVELAGYVGWYPRLEPAAAFDFTLDVDSPSGLEVACNGRSLGAAPGAPGREVRRFASYEPTGDLAVVAAPGLRLASARRDGVTVEVLSAALPRAYVDAMLEDILRATAELSRLSGAPLPAEVVRVVYSPRPGWGYVRRPLIVVSETGALAAQTARFGRARDLRYVAHEVAHYWWHQAAMGTPEDWINEGLAEYTAYLASERLVGRDFAAELLAEYEERSAASATTSAIAQTEDASPDREVNRYTRPVLMLDEERRRCGADRLDGFIAALYSRFSRAGRATTADFLEQAATSLGPESRDRLAAALYRKDWSTAPAQALTTADSRFLGTWTGTLAQAGATTRVILHLVGTNGVLSAAIDSPDQGAKGIPVPLVRLSGDSLRFSLGAFGIRYAGALEPGGSVVRGEWTQGGIPTPLVLSRSAPE